MGLLKTETSQPRFVEYTVLRTPTTARTAAAAVTRVHGREVNVTTNRVHSYLKLSQKLWLILLSSSQWKRVPMTDREIPVPVLIFVIIDHTE